MALDLTTGMDSPVRMPSSHSHSSAVSKAKVGRNEGPDPQRHHVTGYQLRDRHTTGLGRSFEPLPPVESERAVPPWPFQLGIR